MVRYKVFLVIAKYIAPYVNRIDAQGGNGIETVSELQTLLKQHQLNAKVCAAQLPHFTSGIRLLVGWLWFDYDPAGCG